jgi:hypothetical protein
MGAKDTAAAWCGLVDRLGRSGRSGWSGWLNSNKTPNPAFPSFRGEGEGWGMFQNDKRSIQNARYSRIFYSQQNKSNLFPAMAVFQPGADIIEG